MTDKPILAFILDTPLLSPALVKSYIRSQQIQITRDFAGPWGVDATCVFIPGGQPIPPASYEIWLKDHTDDAGALGFHTDDGKPRSIVGVADALAGGQSWMVTASHEALEMLADPTIDKFFRAGGFDYAVEVADPCEDDEFAKFIAGHHLSNFVLPSWFDPDGVAPFTAYACPEIDAPFKLASGGYIGQRPVGGVWSQRFGPGERTSRMVKAVTSRTMRRFTA